MMRKSLPSRGDVSSLVQAYALQQEHRDPTGMFIASSITADPSFVIPVKVYTFWHPAKFFASVLTCDRLISLYTVYGITVNITVYWRSYLKHTFRLT